MGTSMNSPVVKDVSGMADQRPEARQSDVARKWQRVLRAFLSGRSLNRWEAARDLRDWCLHSTVADLEARGVRIARKSEVVPGQFGAVHCKRYWLEAESHQRALELLAINRTSSLTNSLKGDLYA